MSNLFEHQAKPHRGSLLLAEPFMWDPNFKRSVVLLCEHKDETGTFGLIVNRPLDITLGDVMPDLLYFDVPLYFGGPLDPNTLHYIHRHGNKLNDCIHIGHGIYWGGNFGQLKDLIADKEIERNDIRFFIGYSSWQEKQLAEELREGSWIVSEANIEHVFGDKPQHLWKNVLEGMGGLYREIAGYPEDPGLN